MKKQKFTQMTLIKNSSSFVTKKELEISNKISNDMKKHPVEYCIKYLKNSTSVWDMRCWHNHKDYDEVKEWISKDIPDHKNGGHAGFCIMILRDGHKIPIDTIIEAIRANPHITYEDADYVGNDIFTKFHKQMEEDPEVEVHSV